MKQTEDIFKKATNVIESGLTKNNFSKYENRILWFIFRKTYLWQKEMDAISLGQIEKGTGINRWHLNEKLRGLVRKRVILKNKSAYITQYGINPCVNEWDRKQPKETQTSTCSGTSTCSSTGVVLVQVPKLVPPAVPTKKEVFITMYTQQAEDIYSAYPRKADKDGSIRSIQKLLMAGETKESLMAAIERYKGHIKQNSVGPQFIIQSNNFFGEKARYKEFLKGTQDCQEQAADKITQAMERCMQRGDY